jgi:homoserine kinase
MSRAALLVAGMQTNHPEYLSIATQDRLHQPYRQEIFPPMKVIFAAARDAGALGVFLSGSGSAIMALTQERAMTVAYEMFDAARLCGVDGKVEVTRPTELGAHVVSATAHR